MIRNASFWIEKLGLTAHPEGGYYRQTYRAHHVGEDGRAASTAIYFLLAAGEFSAFHRIRSDELWHFYMGQCVIVHQIDADGAYSRIAIGADFEAGEQFQASVPGGCWFAAEIALPAGFALVGCTVAPGFEFSDFELATRAKLVEAYPQHQRLIECFTRA